ncbi:MAG: protein PB2B2 [Rubrobacteraceae bacterium]|nr:protein PB2B2 [Rubrobacteraceae bacterium]
MILDHRADLYEACQRLCPIDPAYANLPIEQGFNWFSCLGDARFEGLYLVVFRSVRRAAADLALLEEHDDQAYAAALEAGGLLRYFKGEVNGRRECLSFCLWERREQALSASSRSLAMSLAAPHLAQETTRQTGDDENIA